MSTTSQKHRNFVAEPMNEKPVTDLAGIGEVLGKRLESKGFDKAYVVLGQVRNLFSIDIRLVQSRTHLEETSNRNSSSRDPNLIIRMIISGIFPLEC